ncbi:MAG: MAPEG family protein [Halobacteriovoraceae bacterium]|nr:MAPEG family protein [Halobacteriovoraceae bacterium]MCB9095240.1 MAPEG family protein [Halobacteriovoraceae bacterium]
MNSSHPILYPMFAQVLLIYCVLLYMLLGRKKSIRRGELDIRYFKTYDFGDVPAKIKQMSRHFTNLFEIPVLYFTACLIALIRDIQNPLVIWLAWFFVLARVIHSFIHLGKNKIYPRLIAYASCVVINLLIWILVIF